MTITVQIPTALRRLTAGAGRITCSATNLGELFSVLDQRFPDLKPHLRDEAGQIRRFLNVYVNEEDIRFLGGNTYAFQDGDEVLLVPSIAGGSAEAVAELGLEQGKSIVLPVADFGDQA
jgi:sulfur-carrier protein